MPTVPPKRRSTPTPSNPDDPYTRQYKSTLLYLGQLEYNIHKLNADIELLLNEREITLSSIKTLEELIESTPRN